MAGDALDLIPFVTGVGETIKGTRIVAKGVDAADSALTTIRFAKAANYADNFADAGDMLSDFKHVGKYGFTITDHVKGTKLHSLFMGNGERIFGTKLRVDGLDDVAKCVYELKPLNRRNLRKGVKQIFNYNDKLGGGYQMIVVFY